GRWRWVLWTCLGIGFFWMTGAFAVAGHAIAVGNVNIESSGDLRDLDQARGSVAWWGTLQSVFFAVLAVSLVSSIARQTLAYRQSIGERRLQLKWLLAGAAVFAVGAPLS